MKAGRWTTVTLLLTLISGGLIAGSSYALDVFGIFHDPKGLPFSVQFNERTAKYFLNQRYVPTNFDALLIGGSGTSNWPMEPLDFAHVYNESVYGANNVEAKRLVDVALLNGHFRYAICAINPYMLESHDIHEGSVAPPRREALGSVNVLREELFLFRHKLSHARSGYWADGGRDMVPTVAGLDTPLTFSFQYDPIALEAFRQMLDELRARGTKIIFLETPLYEPAYEQHKAQFEAFYAAFPYRHADEPLISMDGPEFRAWRSDRSHWEDPPHLNNESARTAAVVLNRAIHAALPNLQTLPHVTAAAMGN